jgi:hypothetical protein
LVAGGESLGHFFLRRVPAKNSVQRGFPVVAIFNSAAENILRHSLACAASLVGVIYFAAVAKSRWGGISAGELT